MLLDQPTTLCLELLDFAQKYKPYLLPKSMKSWLKLKKLFTQISFFVIISYKLTVVFVLNHNSLTKTFDLSLNSKCFCCVFFKMAYFNP